MVPFPCSCDECDDHEYWGCGFKGFEGKSKVHYEKGATVEPYSRTCPRFYWADPAVQQIRMDLADYKRGALGPVHHLEVQHLELLRIAEAEDAAWEAEQTAQLMDD